MENEISAPLRLQSKKKIMQDSEFSLRRMLWFNPASWSFAHPHIPNLQLSVGWGRESEEKTK